MEILIAILAVLIGVLAAKLLVQSIKVWIYSITSSFSELLYPKLLWRSGNLVVALRSALGFERESRNVRRVSKEELYNMYRNGEISYEDYRNLTNDIGIDL